MKFRKLRVLSALCYITAKRTYQLEQGYQQVVGKIALIDEVLKWDLDEIIIEKEKHGDA